MCTCLKYAYMHSYTYMHICIHIKDISYNSKLLCNII